VFGWKRANLRVCSFYVWELVLGDWNELDKIREKVEFVNGFWNELDKMREKAEFKARNQNELNKFAEKV